jgi:hypothetical protein
MKLMLGTIRERHGAQGAGAARIRRITVRPRRSQVALHPLLITPMLDTMAPRTTTTVRVYPETRAEIARRAELEGVTAAELLERVMRRSADEELLEAMLTWDEQHADELYALAREPYPLEPDDIPPSPTR